MKKLLFILLLITGLAIPTLAETVSQKQAQQLAHIFFNQNAGKITAPPKLVYNGKRLTTDRLFTPFYVYNTSLGGFVIISGENKAFPILGFSLKDSFNPDELGETELALLKSYATEIEQVRYDSEPVDGAVWAWQNYGPYIESILTSKYQATDPKLSIEEASLMIDNSLDTDEGIFSDIYTPEQWSDMILDELAIKESVPVGIIENNKIFPTVIYGRQGDYFRFEMTRRNNWLMRLNATEVMPANMVTLVVNPIQLTYDFAEIQPFEELDLFIEEVNETENLRHERSSIDIPQFDGTLKVKANGGGHYEIILPENVKESRVYNLSGSLVKKQSFSGSQNANIDISEQPSGFYIVNLTGDSGTSYGIKLHR